MQSNEDEIINEMPPIPCQPDDYVTRECLQMNLLCLVDKKFRLRILR